ncbi:haloacid dehalogenase [Aureimonas sp. SA4125]|uniref:HAD family hydrolase n=1 Tax=Aureimonas sp. SA4125 TaxID=2826993 RepID=UPI001CC3E361|nr:HAD family phosphatase [Aureimonas sp. SA4125]BDA83111.1 haloacid dehalogenase [Aureimonas sp. SA4125]
MPPLSLAIFDCDGVLVDSEIIAARVESVMFKEFGIDMEAEEIASRFAGLTLPRILDILADENGIVFPADFEDRVEKETDVRLGREVEAIAGVEAMLDRIDLPRCICSNSTTVRLEMELGHVRLWDRFRPYVFAAREVGSCRGKPAPDVFLYACEQFGVAPARAVVIEDSVHGVVAAVAAGCRVVGFTGGSHTYPGHADALSEAGAETVISRLADYPAVIEAFGAWSAA